MITRISGTIIFGAVTLLFAGPADEPAASGSTVLEIDGTKISLAQFEQQRPSALFQARNTFYETERKAVEEFATDYLLERQATKEGVTIAELLRRHVDGEIGKDPGDDALLVYYEGLDTTEPFAAVRDKIIDHVRQKRVAKARSAYLQSLRDQAKITLAVSPPRAQISLKDTPVRGPGSAPVTLVEYADYECPFCQQVQPQLDKLEADFKGRLAFAYKDMPLPMHGHAQKAAEAAQCAGLQNKYWEFHDLLLKTKDLEIPQMKAGAARIGLDSTKFDACLDSGQRAEAVKATLDEAQRLGLQGTPSFFLNGRFFSGNIPYEQLHQMVDEELTRPSKDTIDRASR